MTARKYDQAAIDAWCHLYDRWISEQVDADDKYGPFTSAAEGLGVLLEEFHEVREAIRANDAEAITHEALQVSAVAFRLAVSLTNRATLERSGCVKGKP